MIIELVKINFIILNLIKFNHFYGVVVVLVMVVASMVASNVVVGGGGGTVGGTVVLGTRTTTTTTTTTIAIAQQIFNASNITKSFRTSTTAASSPQRCVFSFFHDFLLHDFLFHFTTTTHQLVKRHDVAKGFRSGLHG